MFDISDSELLTLMVAKRAQAQNDADWQAALKDVVAKFRQEIANLENEAKAHSAAAEAYSPVLDHFRQKYPNDPMWAKSRHLFKNKARGAKPRWRTELFEPAYKAKMAEKKVAFPDAFVA